MEFKKGKIKKTFSVILAFFGIILILISVVPILGYLSYSRENFTDLKNPLYKEEVNEFDSKKASEWFFDNVSQEDFQLPKVSYYTLSIPKLEIEKATTSIGGEDLSKSLIHYPGTALPGRVGNSVIFGHSVLPVFYDPKNYLSIFSKLPQLEKGNEIIIEFDGVTFTYLVEDLFEVKPQDIQILEQNSSSPYLTLVTCTPPGDPRKPKRLIVRAKIISQENAYADIRN